MLGLQGSPVTGKVLIAEEQIGPDSPENWPGDVPWVCWRLLTPGPLVLLAAEAGPHAAEEHRSLLCHWRSQLRPCLLGTPLSWGSSLLSGVGSALPQRDVDRIAGLANVQDGGPCGHGPCRCWAGRVDGAGCPCGCSVASEFTLSEAVGRFLGVCEVNMLELIRVVLMGRVWAAGMLGRPPGKCCSLRQPGQRGQWRGRESH